MHERLIDSVGSDDKPLISDLNATYCKKKFRHKLQLNFHNNNNKNS